MDLTELLNETIRVAVELDKSSKRKWEVTDMMVELTGEVGSLADSIMLHEGLKKSKVGQLVDIDDDLADILFVLIRISNHYGVNLFSSYNNLLNALNVRIKTEKTISLVLGFTGLPAAGKGTAINYLRTKFEEGKYKVYLYSLSDILREEVQKKGLIVERDNLRTIANSMRKTEGNGILAVKTAKLILDSYYEKETMNIIFIDSIRNPVEILELKRVWANKFILLGLTSPLQVLVERIKNRNRFDENNLALRNIDDAIEMLSKELGENEPDYGHNLKKCIEFSDYIIENDAKFEDFNNSLESVISSIKIKHLNG